MIDYAGFDHRARLIGERLHCPPEAVPGHFHTIITDFCDSWLPLGPTEAALHDRMLCYEMLWRFVLERCEHRLQIPTIPELWINE